MKYLFSFFLMLLTLCSFSQNNTAIYLWPGKVPGEVEKKQPPVIAASKNDNVLRYSEVTDPAIEVRLADPANRNGCGVIVCPGGGYNILAYDKEGTEIATWLNKLGYSAFVLLYRVPDKRDGALQDVQRAVRIVRENADQWKLDPEKIGVMGFSAGGNLSARASILFNKRTYLPVDKADSLSCRPSFTILIYPAYLDQGPDHTLTPELQLNKEVPGMFIFQTADDPHGNSALVMATALRNAKIPVEMHLMPAGGHGYGLRPGTAAAEMWPKLAGNWLTKSLIDSK